MQVKIAPKDLGTQDVNLKDPPSPARGSPCFFAQITCSRTSTKMKEHDEVARLCSKESSWTPKITQPLKSRVTGIRDWCQN